MRIKPVPPGKETLNDEFSKTIIPVEITISSETALLTFTITPENQNTPTITPQNQITPTITLPAFIAESCISSTAERVEAQVVRVIDGDTIVVSIDGQEFNVRYIGIDSPETGYKFSTEATEYNTKLLASGIVMLLKDTSETDRYDRLLNRCFC